MNSIKTDRQTGSDVRVFLVGILLAWILFLTGCQAVPVYQQAMVSQPGMYFSNSPIDAYEPALLTQVEPGIASNGGGQAAGCSSCR